MTFNRVGCVSIVIQQVRYDVTTERCFRRVKARPGRVFGRPLVFVPLVFGCSTDGDSINKHLDNHWSMLFEPAVRPDREARFGICEDLMV